MTTHTVPLDKKGGRPHWLKIEGTPIEMGDVVVPEDLGRGILIVDEPADEQIHKSYRMRVWTFKIGDGYGAITEIVKLQ